MTSTRPATSAEIATTAHLPLHKRVAEVETNEDGRAVVGKAKTVHRATIVTDLNVHGDSIGRTVNVFCGAERYRNGRSSASAVSSRYSVDCTRCEG